MNAFEQLSSQEPISLLRWSALLSLITFYDGIGGYNLPITLFGIIAHQQTSSTESWKQFLMILFSSFFIDAFRLLGRTSGFGFILGAVLIGLKVAVYFSGMRTLRERGDDLRWSHVGDMVRNPRNAFRSGGGETLGGSADNGNNSQTIWQMPGAFGGAPAAPRDDAATFPASGGFRLGTADEDPERDAGVGHPVPSNTPGRGGYQTLP
ncbi:hypothetical protein QFC22_001305 [Naganishia vaughanmartiniae]|uniref:Uncharacterized protein n=1 Tax=Naganishia vaughanmartiniae TaxID=1424756 RepID=A0ACC2XGF4_9TREE|nr:hypothetical protein QFC22_001305 [Naganishia vaughanmartiniae]